MAYGTALARAYYGAGDYQSRAALRGIGYNASSYYAAGGFFGNLAKKAKKALNSQVGKLATTALGYVPGIGTAASGALKMLSGQGGSLGGLLVPGYDKVMKGGLLGTKFSAAITPTSSSAGKTTLAPFGKVRSVEAPRRRRKTSKRTRRAAPRRASSRRRRRGRPQGDWGDDGGRDKRGHFLNARGGHQNFRRRRRRRSGGRVSFTTKDGRRVSFTAKGDSP